MLQNPKFCFRQWTQSVGVYLTDETGPFRQLRRSVKMIFSCRKCFMCEKNKIVLHHSSIEPVSSYQLVGKRQRSTTCQFIKFIQKHWVVISLEGYSLQYAWKLRMEDGWSSASLHMSNARDYKEQLIRKGDHASCLFDLFSNCKIISYSLSQIQPFQLSLDWRSF